MKKLIVLVVALFILSAVPVMAEPYIDWLDDMEGESQRIGVDAPNLVRLSDHWYYGAEISRDMHNTSSWEGWDLYIAKFTYDGTLFSFHDVNKV